MAFPCNQPPCFLPPPPHLTFFRCLQNYFCHEKDGEFSADKIKELPSGVAAMGDPSQMMNQQV